MPWTKIDKDKPLNPGDLVQLDFRILSGLWLSSMEIAMIESQLSNRDDWEIISNNIPAQGRITFTVKVKDYPPEGSWLQNPARPAGLVFTTIAVTAVTIAASICAVGLITSLVFYEARLFVKETSATVGGQIASTGIGAAGVAFLLYVIYKFLRER